MRESYQSGAKAFHRGAIPAPFPAPLRYRDRMLTRTALPLLVLVTLSTFLACDDSASSPAPGTSSSVDAGVDSGGPAPVVCPTPTGAGTPHQGFLEASETWTAAASPHHVTAALTVRAGATLTIEPCAVVTLDPDVHFTVEDTLVAKNATFKAAQDGKAWGSFEVDAKANATLTEVTFSDGGSAGDGTIFARGAAGGTNDGEPTKNLHIEGVTVTHSRSWGVNLEGWAAFADGSTGLVITDGGSDDAPSALRMEPGVVSTLPSGIVATGNKKNDILLETSKTFLRNDTLVARALPYRAKGALYVSPAADGAPVTLTIEPGVTIGFENNAGSGIRVGSSEKRQGLLLAVGTPDKPIVFTSGKDAKTAGDWTNVDFHATPTSGNHIAYARFEYAGGASGAKGFGCGPADNDGAIFIEGLGAESKGPTAPFVDHTTFEHIAGTTVIVSGWVDDAGPSMVETNTFGAEVPSCHVSRPQRTGAGDTCDGGRKTCW